LYDWQCRILLRYEAGEPIAAACADYTGKTSVIFPICALWTLYNFPRARLMYTSATYDQVVNQFFAGLKRFVDHRYFAGWQWLESEVRTTSGGFLFGRASDVGGHVEGIHDPAGSAFVGPLTLHWLAVTAGLFPMSADGHLSTDRRATVGPPAA